MNIFNAETNVPMGVINWFAVHPTSMNNTNHLISGDNKGLASQLLERHVNPKSQLSGTVSIKTLLCLFVCLFVFMDTFLKEG